MKCTNVIHHIKQIQKEEKNKYIYNHLDIPPNWVKLKSIPWLWRKIIHQVEENIINLIKGLIETNNKYVSKYLEKKL